MDCDNTGVAISDRRAGFQDFDEVFVQEALEKFETGAKDIQVVLTADPALSPSDVEIIMHIVLAKERELAEQEKKDEKSD